MSEPTGFTHLDDPAFLDERSRLYGRLEHLPENASDRAELERRYEAMTEEFLRRARIAWTSVPAPAEPGLSVTESDRCVDDAPARYRLASPG